MLTLNLPFGMRQPQGSGSGRLEYLKADAHPGVGVILQTVCTTLSATVLSGHWYERSPIKVGFVSLRRQVLLGWLYQKIQNRCDQWGGLGDISVNLRPDETLSFAPTMKLFPLHLPKMGLALFSFEW